eukprot:scaffold874_cov233-Pinguiococcus_pyrenoidosus.AAC.10
MAEVSEEKPVVEEVEENEPDVDQENDESMLGGVKVRSTRLLNLRWISHRSASTPHLLSSGKS